MGRLPLPVWMSIDAPMKCRWRPLDSSDRRAISRILCRPLPPRVPQPRYERLRRQTVCTGRQNACRPLIRVRIWASLQHRVAIVKIVAASFCRGTARTGVCSTGVSPVCSMAVPAMCRTSVRMLEPANRIHLRRRSTRPRRRATHGQDAHATLSLDESRKGGVQ